jgi:hypothetical protein
MMANIYSYAKNTKLWLGPAEDNNEEIMLKLAHIVIDRGVTNPSSEWLIPASAAQAEGQAVNHV